MSVVYFARSIRGERGTQDNKINKMIIDTIKKENYCALDISVITGETEDVHIYQRDIERLNQSDLLIAEVTHPSLGVGYEIAYAQHIRKIPILCVAQIGTRVSAMLTGSNVVMYYEPEAIPELRRLLMNFLDNYEEPKHE